MEESRSLQARARGMADPEDGVTLTRLRLNDAWIAWAHGHEEEMADPAREGLAMAREIGDPTVIFGALDAAQVPAWNCGQHSRAVELGQERLELIETNPASPTLDVERSDALHMMVESLLQTGAFRKAAEFAADAKRLDLGRGIAYSAWERDRRWLRWPRRLPRSEPSTVTEATRRPPRSGSCSASRSPPTSRGRFTV